MIWANGELFRSIVTSATFDGDQGNFDPLYVLPSPYTFAEGYDHLSGSAPGDRDYNGGRWEVFMLKTDGAVPPNYIATPEELAAYAGVTSTDDGAFDPDHWMSVHVYFECPMLPMRGRGHRK